MEVYVDSDADVGYLDFKPDESDVDANAEPGVVDSVDLVTVAGTKDRDVMVAGIEQPMHMDDDNMEHNTEILELDEFPISH